MSYEKINRALEVKYGKPQDYSFEQLIAMQKEAQESGLADQLKAMVLNEARDLPADPTIPAGTDPLIAALAKTQPEVAQKLLKLQETQRQLAESMAGFKNSGPSMK
jgi:hypothetical protein